VAKRRVEISFERERLILLKNRTVTVSAYCELCQAQSFFTAPEYAARSSPISIRLIYRQLEAGQLHFLEGPNGQVLVCTKSLNEETPESNTESGKAHEIEE
jgi:hypothetical protein